MTTFIAFRAAAAASLLRTNALPAHRCCPPQIVAIAIRHAARQAMPGANHLRNQDIPHRTVQLANEEGRLEAPIPLSHLIASIDPKTHYVELVTADPQPIVKIKDKREEYNKLKAWNKKQKEAAASRVQKEIQMTWGVDSGDLAHKLKKARKELEKGNRVDLAFAPKTNQAPPKPQIMDIRLQEVVEMLSDIATEWMPRRVEKGVAVIYLQKGAGKPLKPAKTS